ncbi:transcriptional regulator [Lentilactobacillus senioris DSM 24302 = JCM 17472]|uniref:Transcriptional regulator n=1 Tax=Lentilactobacillus senioris DSM 24302 = JCM 17472 TaxID=1423802 RepID=A0A0R2D231_9LACO|nr:LysR family transcriptional regulator [Lentilactobacillus senioris]KRM94585.1 transcriptional regulator [Lentilactobacillus senioris DSM 24302 = JCM 17472]
MLDHRYHTFLTLVQTGSYTVTAEHLYISQPAVTQQIKSLEREIGVPLVRYHRPHLQITVEGQKLAQFISTIEVQSQQVMQQLRTPNVEREISFAATLSVSDFLVPQLILKLQKLGYTRIDCQTANTESALKKLDDGTSQFALIEGNFDKDNYDYQVIRQEPFIGVASVANELVNQTNLTVPELQAQSLLLREPGSGTRDIFKNFAGSLNIELTDFSQVVTVDSPTAIRELLLQNAGISFMYQSLVQSEIDAGLLAKLPLQDLQLQHELTLVWIKDSYFAEEYEHLFE